MIDKILIIEFLLAIACYYKIADVYFNDKPVSKWDVFSTGLIICDFFAAIITLLILTMLTLTKSI